MPIRLLLRNLFGHPLRAILTVGSVTIAVFLLCILMAVSRGLDAAVAQASSTRLWVQSSVSLFVSLPNAYGSKIQSTPGVEDVVRFQWFGGVYQDTSNFFAQFAVDPKKWKDSYPEIEIREGSLADWQKSRTGCIIGEDLAARFGWKVGDRVPLIGTIFPRSDGSNWEFDVAGIYHSNSLSIDQMTMFFDFQYLRESQEQNAVGGPDGVGVYLTRLAPNTDPDGVIAAIETEYENGPQAVRVTTEAEFQRQFITMLGSVPTLLASIGGGVLFAIFFAVLNTMLMAARERTRDIGILKALGFGNAKIGGMLIIESLLICATGGAVGIFLAKSAERPLWSAISSQIPGFEISSAVLMLGISLAIALGILAGIAPALRARNLQPVAALRLGA
ncbi:MAG: putative ABC transport system permease protein [Planctomycetota bacterium]|jgi:putative ABC transport system permease protein